jgi:mannose-6-phosphate isomerase-like protein (cupin superfamily)
MWFATVGTAARSYPTWENRPMRPYTVKNLKEIEDQAPNFGLSPGLEARFARKPLDSESSGVSYQRLAPNFRIPFGHKHGNQEEIYVLVSGSGRLKLDDDVVELKQWDAVRISKDTIRNLEAGPDGAELLAFGAGGGGLQDADMTPDWWTD